MRIDSVERESGLVCFVRRVRMVSNAETQIGLMTVMLLFHLSFRTVITISQKRTNGAVIVKRGIDGTIGGKGCYAPCGCETNLGCRTSLLSAKNEPSRSAYYVPKTAEWPVCRDKIPYS